MNIYGALPMHYEFSLSALLRVYSCYKQQMSHFMFC